jgi:hypothetical protein
MTSSVKSKQPQERLAAVKFSIAILVVAFGALSRTVMADASTQPALIEPSRNAPPAPRGYRWYIVRDWQHVYTGKASGVARGASVGEMFDTDELVFQQEVGDTLRQRNPRTPGEVSHILLPASFELPSDVQALRATPVPAALSANAATAFPPITLQKEDVPGGAPPGFTAYTFVLPGLVYTGTADGVRGDGTAFHLHGSGLRSRRAKRPGEASHILLPNGVSIPEALKRRSQ